jgi:hypothetical protein
MTDVLGAILSWQTFLVALLVFGLAPGAALRLIVLSFERDDPRRRELLAELHAVPRFERPFWVVEQLEVAVSEGIWPRIEWAATGRIIWRWHLASGVERNREHPDTFWIPSENAKRAVRPGMGVKLPFELNDGSGDRMWVRVVAVKRRHLVGVLKNQPIMIPRLDAGAKIKFRLDHVIDIMDEDEIAEVERRRTAEEGPGRIHHGCNAPDL